MSTDSPPRLPDDVDTYVGAEIRRLRRMRGMSQAELGRQIGITFQQIQKYERGSNRVSASMLFRICRVLECAPADLFPPIISASPTRNEAFDVEGVDRLASAYASLSKSERRAVLQLVETFSTAESPEPA